MQNCEVSDNLCQVIATGLVYANAYGGGLYFNNGTVNIRNCIFLGNTVSSTERTPGGVDYSEGWGSYGSGIYADSSGILGLTNVVIADNEATSIPNPANGPGSAEGGGGIYVANRATNAFNIINCTIAYNTPQGLLSAGNSSVMNSIFFFNNGNGTQISGPTNVTYCDVQGGFTGTGNINRNPIFLSTTNLIIVPGSPCINAGNPNAIYNNVYFPPSIGVGVNDIGAHGGPGAGASLSIAIWPPAEVFFYGGVPGYNYLIQASTNLLSWQTVEPVQITNLGDVASFLEPSTNTLPHRFYKLNLAP